jgi:hypothetical protein
MYRIPMIVIALFVSCCTSLVSNAAAPAVVVGRPNAPFAEQLAAREVRRYVYLRTGELLPITTKAPAGGDLICIGIDKGLGLQTHELRSVTKGGRTILHITGGSDIAALYGAYRYAETLAVRFYVHGDVIPDQRVPFALPEINETHEPLFEHRGIQPFHDFTEGPDWWSIDDYKTYISQLAKMRMNWIGFHCYPEGGVGPEPLVWIGLPEDVNDDGSVKFSYPARWASTSGGTFGYAPTKTSEFAAGAGLLFAEDDFGPSVIEAYHPRPQTVEGSNDVFNRTGKFLNEALTHARSLGIKSVIGTETPLTIPKELKAYLQAKGMNANDPATVQKLYEGMFKRIRKAHPLDYYWLWTPEGWTWSGTKQAEVDAAMRDIKMALRALDSQGKPFGFATSGWVLGPAHDRSLFDKSLPKDAAIACINRQVGFAPIEPGFAGVEGRPQWAIPWVEDDPAMVIPQLWAGRMRRDAADAHAYGCTGLLGIHWRTKVLAPNFAALAAAAWEQEPWNAHFGQRITVEQRTNDIHLGGQTAAFTHPVEKTNEDPVYQTVRYDVDAYRVKVPNGRYTVTLKFSEPYYDEAGKRVFGVILQGDKVIDQLDVRSQAGQNVALDRTFANVKVSDEVLTIKFVEQVEFPCIAGIVIDGVTAASNQLAGEKFLRKINCGGGNWRDYEPDLPGEDGVASGRNLPRDMPIDDFYADWCQTQFGADVAAPMGAIFTRIDGGGPSNISQSTRGANLPRPATWIAGPGGIVVNGNPWTREKARYAFVDEMAQLRDKVRGAGNLARFDYWLNTMRYLRAVGQAGCVRGELDRAMGEVHAQKDPAKKRQAAERALTVRIQLARQWEAMMTLQLAATDTPGAMGTIANLEQHVRRNALDGGKHRFMDIHDAVLAKALGRQLPDATHPTTRYLGAPRLIVPTVRTSVGEGQSLTLKVIVLDKERPTVAAIFWRPMGKGEWQRVSLTHVARGVYTGTLPPGPELAIEYYVRVTTATGRTLLWPATAPTLNQTVVVMPPQQGT